ncbi:MAG TPA: hypothetical protein VKW08_14835 [Xanthobacteraceae bacterium]|nr:hypothetical protein [Xanthobacteraceae bacterium]
MVRDRRAAWPTRIVDELNRQINRTLADPVLRARLADVGGTIIPAFAVFFELIAAETETWRKVVAFSGAKPE